MWKPNSLLARSVQLSVVVVDVTLLKTRVDGVLAIGGVKRKTRLLPLTELFRLVIAAFAGKVLKTEVDDVELYVGVVVTFATCPIVPEAFPEAKPRI